MKDFYDIVILAKSFEFDGALLARAVRATFERRKTPFPEELPIALTSAFAEDPSKQTQWTAFLRKSGVPDGGPLAQVVRSIVTFAGPILTAAARHDPCVARWPVGGPWRL